MTDNWTIIITTSIAALSPLIALAMTIFNQPRNEFKREMSKEFYLKRLEVYSELYSLITELTTTLYAELSRMFHRINNSESILSAYKNEYTTIYNNKYENFSDYFNALNNIKIYKYLYLPSNLGNHLFTISNYISILLINLRLLALNDLDETQVLKEISASSYTNESLFDLCYKLLQLIDEDKEKFIFKL